MKEARESSFRFAVLNKKVGAGMRKAIYHFRFAARNKKAAAVEKKGSRKD
jgi:hypothetical protein